MAYSNWQLQRSLMSQPDYSIEERFYALVLVHNVDWKTGEKGFTSKNHMVNWFNMLAERNGLKPETFGAVLSKMKTDGYAEMRKHTLVLVGAEDA